MAGTRPRTSGWTEILQELRVTQTGTQIITGFLLTLAFQQRFADLDSFQVTVYLALVITASVSTALALAPVSMHRVLFRQRAKGPLVHAGHRILKVVLVSMVVVLTGTVLLIFDVVLGRVAGMVAGGGILTAMVALAVFLPIGARRRSPA